MQLGCGGAIWVLARVSSCNADADRVVWVQCRCMQTGLCGCNVGAYNQDYVGAV